MGDIALCFIMAISPKFIKDLQTESQDEMFQNIRELSVDRRCYFESAAQSASERSVRSLTLFFCFQHFLHRRNRRRSARS